MLEANLQQRIERLYQDYVVYSLEHFKNRAQVEPVQIDPWQALEDHVLAGLSRIQKRLGGLRYKQLCGLLSESIILLRDRNDRSGFDALIRSLLHDYYDKLYQQHLINKQSRTIFSGNMDEIQNWLRNQSQHVN